MSLTGLRSNGSTVRCCARLTPWLVSSELRHRNDPRISNAPAESGMSHGIARTSDKIYSYQDTEETPQFSGRENIGGCEQSQATRTPICQ
jgi:hypothetical protein